MHVGPVVRGTPGTAWRWVLFRGAGAGAVHGAAAAAVFALGATGLLALLNAPHEPSPDFQTNLVEMAAWSFRAAVPIGAATGAVGGAVLGLLAHRGAHPLQVLALVVMPVPWVVAVAVVHVPVDLLGLLLLVTWVPGQTIVGVVAGVLHAHRLDRLRRVPQLRPDAGGPMSSRGPAGPPP